MTEDTLSTQHPELFHYTTLAGFQGIHRTQCLWATHCRDLNDYTELKRFEDILRKHIEPLLHEIIHCRNAADVVIRARQEAITQAQVFSDMMFDEDGYDGPFICSFCAHSPQTYPARNGLLSQWRGYGSGGGVAVVFDTAGLEEAMRREKEIFSHSINHLGCVHYDNDENEIKKEYPEFFDCFPAALTDLSIGKAPNYPGDITYAAFLEGSTLVKHQAFLEEEEVRIVVSPRSPKGKRFYNAAYAAKPRKDIRYRSRGVRKVRYIELFGHQTSRLPITRIIIGPSRCRDMHYQTVCDLVADTDIVVCKSETPFLD